MTTVFFLLLKTHFYRLKRLPTGSNARMNTESKKERYTIKSFKWKESTTMNNNNNKNIDDRFRCFSAIKVDQSPVGSL